LELNRSTNAIATSEFSGGKKYVFDALECIDDGFDFVLKEILLGSADEK
jgi:hypothetical protein